MNKIKYFILSLSFFLTNAIQAQNDSNALQPKVYEVELISSKIYTGTILKDDGREIEMMTQSMGKMIFAKTLINRISVIKKDVTTTTQDENGEITEDVYKTVNEEPFTTRYHFTNNALPNKKGDHYFLLSLFGPEVHFGVTKNLTVGIMTSWVTDPAVLVTKYAFNSKSNTHFSIGNLVGVLGYIVGSDDSQFGGLHWGTITQGDRSNNLSLSLGYGWRESNNEARMSFGIEQDDDALVIGLGGIAKLSKKASLIFDSMVFSSANSTTFFIMPGIRIAQDRGKALQFALTSITLLPDDFTIPLPYVSWLRKF